MDPAGVGIILGLFGLLMVGAGVYIYDRSILGAPLPTAKPLLTKKKPFKVRNLFSHVEI